MPINELEEEQQYDDGPSESSPRSQTTPDSEPREDTKLRHAYIQQGDVTCG